MDALPSNEIEGIGYHEHGTRRGRSYVQIYRTLALNHKAEIARSLVERWGTVAATPDGYDRAGRQMLRLQTPQELVDHACATAELLVNEFRRWNWLLVLPAPAKEEPEVAEGGDAQ